MKAIWFFARRESLAGALILAFPHRISPLRKAALCRPARRLPSATLRWKDADWTPLYAAQYARPTCACTARLRFGIRLLIRNVSSRFSSHLISRQKPSILL